MKIQITIETGNAAFASNPAYEVGRILKVWVNKSIGYGEPMETALVDVSGNTVGHVTIEDESIDEAVRRHEEANPDEQSGAIDGDGGYLINP